MRPDLLKADALGLPMAEQLGRAHYRLSRHQVLGQAVEGTVPAAAMRIARRYRLEDRLMQGELGLLAINRRR
jgi:hypothetical protein